MAFSFLPITKRRRRSRFHSLYRLGLCTCSICVRILQQRAQMPSIIATQVIEHSCRAGWGTHVTQCNSWHFSNYLLLCPPIIVFWIVWRKYELCTRMSKTRDNVYKGFLAFLTSWRHSNVQERLLFGGIVCSLFEKDSGSPTLDTCSLEGVSYFAKGCSQCFIQGDP